ncbi:t-SNARE affecting a late Golgi compartment protein 2 [Monosporozyma unispora]|nr:hypothetical protein C6P44_005348 [Kazachstania unispora]
MFRDRTNLYVSYRRTFPHYNRESYGRNDPFGDNAESAFDPLSPTDPFLDDEHNHMDDIELDNLDELQTTRRKNRDTLPPLFVDIARDIDDYLSEVSLDMEQLMKLYRKNSLPGFDDKTHDEKEIEDLSLKILQYFQKCYNIVKKLEMIYSTQTLEGKQLNRSELIILDNMTKKYAQRIQWESNKFRVLQNNYLKFLNKDDLKPIFPRNDKESSELVLTMMEEEEQQNQMNSQGRDIEEYSRQTMERQQLKKQSNSNQRFLEERDEEIAQLANGVFEVSTIFREMQSLIINQGSIVDRIDYNLENTVIELREANKQLDGATRYQKRSQKCKIILLLTLVVIALFFFVMLKPHNHTTVKHETVIQHDTEQVDELPIVIDEPGTLDEDGVEKINVLEEAADNTGLI